MMMTGESGLQVDKWKVHMSHCSVINHSLNYRATMMMMTTMMRMMTMMKMMMMSGSYTWCHRSVINHPLSHHAIFMKLTKWKIGS